MRTVDIPVTSETEKRIMRGTKKRGFKSPTAYLRHLMRIDGTLSEYCIRGIKVKTIRVK